MALFSGNPSSHSASLYFDNQNFDRAALYLSRISQIHPDSAEIHYDLAVAEEARYRFADAGRAYARALELAPENEVLSPAVRGIPGTHRGECE